VPGAALSAVAVEQKKKQEEELEEAMRKEQDKKRKDDEKAAACEKKKAEQRARQEELKNDPVHKARSFADKLNTDIGKAKSIITKLAGLDETLFGSAVQALSADLVKMETHYADLQKNITAACLDGMRAAMEATNDTVANHAKRIRIVTSQLKEFEKLEREAQDGKDKGV